MEPELRRVVGLGRDCAALRIGALRGVVHPQLTAGAKAIGAVEIEVGIADLRERAGAVHAQHLRKLYSVFEVGTTSGLLLSTVAESELRNRMVPLSYLWRFTRAIFSLMSIVAAMAFSSVHAGDADLHGSALAGHVHGSWSRRGADHPTALALGRSPRAHMHEGSADVCVMWRHRR